MPFARPGEYICQTILFINNGILIFILSYFNSFFISFYIFIIHHKHLCPTAATSSPLVIGLLELKIFLGRDAHGYFR
ncbi:MAG: hypothetical protein EBT06_12335 [Gammaproteobacteria bacterium]|nr:hypothetical protein [Gammaproteobacteria bacterium]NBT45675.1 hypothetical protein [Gammaproteobacteria bacterium]NBY21620.1 hypothetical protein [Gammaproteobacteria bacterium]